MGDKKKDVAEDDAEDDRLEFLLTYLTKSYRMKQEKWNKMIGVDEYRKMILNFFNKPTEKMLIMTIPTTGLLTPMTSFNNQIKQKFTYFIRKKEEAVTMENFRDVLAFGDMAGKPVDELAVLMEGVFVPIISNPKNQRGWPKVVTEDVVSHVRNFKNTVEQIRGAMKSQTILPMPQGIQDVFQACQDYQEDEDKINYFLKGSLENAVMKWSSLINDVIKQSSLITFAEGANPTPRNEIDFWNARNKNLESIYDQLCDPRVKKMGEYLGLTHSTYSSTFQTLFKQVVAALVEARDICLYLKALVPNLNRFDDAEIFEAENLVNPLVYSIGLLWANSKYVTDLNLNLKNSFLKTRFYLAVHAVPNHLLTTL
ncbi:unnamed protein product [Acanthoscelides obtectus]|uniref:Dynein heavy chain tail domain-containing protein n=1 Tax=Acanthoscelides obtectus TaxID=200917 RepID=A0A9P0JYL3_ACAOB|nr:unnamed protein product [Acanthoscelides obtectus]CAK1647959.1 hypothetical protein AOBTE_LOCUS15475 [Acanthoscelides obtectus]